MGSYLQLGAGQDYLIFSALRMRFTDDATYITHSGWYIIRPNKISKMIYIPTYEMQRMRALPRLKIPTLQFLEIGQFNSLN